MKMTNAFALLLLCLTGVGAAAETIALNAEDMERLGIVFAPVTEVGFKTGARFPATVVNSPDAASQVSAPFSGIVERWHRDPGSQVEAGALLATLSSQEILDIQNEWLGAWNHLDQTEFDHQKDAALYEQGIIAEQRLRETERRLRQARFQLKARQEKLSQAGFSTTDLQNLREGDANPGRYYLRATAAGTLTHRAYTVGEYVASNTVAASIRKDGQPWVRAMVPARMAANLKSGHALSIDGSLEALTLRQKDFEVDPFTQTVEILAEFDATANYMPGQVISILLPPADGGVLVPSDAVVHGAGQTTVYVRTEAGVDARVLQLQPTGNGYLAQSGIRRGERVAIQGTAVLKGMQLGLGGGE